MVMIFAHPKVREFLLEHGLVYTYRKYHPKTEKGIRPQIGRDWATDKRCGKKIADVHITPMEPIDCLNMGLVLTKYARESGFSLGYGRGDDAVTEWARAINLLNPNEPTQGWIYRVEVLGAKAGEEKAQEFVDLLQLHGIEVRGKKLRGVEIEKEVLPLNKEVFGQLIVKSIK